MYIKIKTTRTTTKVKVRSFISYYFTEFSTFLFSFPIFYRANIGPSSRILIPFILRFLFSFFRQRTLVGLLVIRFFIVLELGDPDVRRRCSRFFHYNYPRYFFFHSFQPFRSEPHGSHLVSWGVNKKIKTGFSLFFKILLIPFHFSTHVFILFILPIFPLESSILFS